MDNGAATPGVGHSRATNGEAIRAIRQALGHTQAWVARQAGINGAYLSNIEAGRKEPSPTVTAKIAAALGVPIAAITYPVTYPAGALEPAA
jgi:transcriptional regulator with XRE-family HTH domain